MTTGDHDGTGGGAAPRGPAWLAGFPGLEALRRTAAEGGLPLRWASEEESREVTGALMLRYAGAQRPFGVVWTDDLWEACRVATDGLRFVAYGPLFHKRFVGDRASQFYVDPRRPDKVIFAPSQDVPAVLWVSVDADPTSVRRLLEEHFPGKPVSALEFPCTLRAFMGRVTDLRLPDPLAGADVPAMPAVLDRHWLSSPVVDEPCWGSEFVEDPLPPRIEPSESPTYMVHQTRAARAQAKGATARFTRRTLFTCSHLAIEMHDEADYVWEVKFKPNPYPEVIERLNAVCRTALPRELPIDVAGAVLGFEFQSAEVIESRLRRAALPEEIITELQHLAAVRHVDVMVADVLRSYIGHDDVFVREAVANLAVSYNWMFVLEDLAVRETHPELASFLAEALTHTFAPPEFNEMGESLEFLERAREYLGA